MRTPKRGCTQTHGRRVGDSILRRRSQLTIAALEGIANHLAGIPGRKNLVWISAAFPFVIPQAISAR